MAQILFILITISSIGFFLFKASKIKRNILLGRAERITDNVGERIKNVVFVALGQKKMFKRWLPATLHFTIYAAFLITQIELLEIFIDGFTGNHRLIWHIVEGTFLGGIYTFVISFIEVLSVLAFIATFAFLARRNLLKIPRFHKSEMNGWPKLDGNIILYLEVVLIIFIFMMNSGDLALQAKGVYHQTDNFAMSQFIAPLWSGLDESTIMLIERIGWWGHILTVFAFLNYLPYSKHLHIMLAFPNVYFANVAPKGEMKHLDSVTEQVNELFGEEEESEPAVAVAHLKTEKNPSTTFAIDESQKEESLDDIFGDTGSSEEGLDDIFGNLGTSEKVETTESLDDIFGDTGSSEEGLDDIFGDLGTSEKVETTESLDDIFGDTGSSEEGLDDIFGDLGTSEKVETTESLDDIFGDTGSSEEGLDDIFGDLGTSEKVETTESLDDIFGDTGSSEETESVDDIFGNSGSSEENVDDIFGNNQEENVDDVFGNNQEESVDDIFGNEKEEETIDDLFGNNDTKTTKTKLVAAELSGKVNRQSIAEPEEEEVPKFGVSDVFDLSWKHILSAYSCTECGRCTDVCPANLTGKKLSPRKIMMDVRDRAEEVGRTLDANPNMTKANYNDGKDLFSYITEEELHACTTCNACVEACPVMIAPLDIIVEMRRHLILDEAKAPESWNVMFTNTENNGAPWQFSNNDRDKWINE
jgi:heterodisulfide reductase subunit C